MQNKTGCALFLFFFLIFSPVVCRANPAYIDDTKGHCVVIEDDADLLTEEEEKVLSFTMSDCAQYGNVLFLTVADNTFSSTEAAVAAEVSPVEEVVVPPAADTAFDLSILLCIL